MIGSFLEAEARTFDISYCFYGGNEEAMYCKAPEVLLSGPSDTGKTLALLTKLHLVAAKYKGASLVILRKQQTDVYGSVLETYIKKVLGDQLGGVAVAYGGSKPEWFDYRNGSRIWIVGLDKPGKVMSSERDIIYVNQAEELSLTDWETLTTRTTGRAGNVPYSQTIGDCNPSSPNHWIRTRAREGTLTFIESKHIDNPSLYEPKTHRLLEEGQLRLARLQKLSGTRRLRLYKGEWAAPEGAIYDTFDGVRSDGSYGVHVVESFDPPLTWPRAVGIDPFGASVAAVWLALDPTTRVLHVYREYREPFGITVQGHASNLLKESRRETIFKWVCGAQSERAWRLEWAAAGIPVSEPPIADVWIGIDLVSQILQEGRLKIHSRCVGLISEMGEYSRKLDKVSGLFTEEIQNKGVYHLLDALRYIIVGLVYPFKMDSSGQGTEAEIICPHVAIA